MNSIKFSHKYAKLLLPKTGQPVPNAMLLQVLDIKLEELSRHFIAYDTDGIYKLPDKGEYLMLVFSKGDDDIFTTLRRKTPSKNEYYRSKVGEYFEIKLEGVRNENRFRIMG